MSLDLPLLRKRLIDRDSFTWTGPAPIPSMCAFILFDWEAREIVERLERAKELAEERDAAYQRGQEDQVIRDVHAWEAAEREMEAVTAERDAMRRRAEAAESDWQAAEKRAGRLEAELRRFVTNSHLDAKRWPAITAALAREGSGGG